MSASEHASLRPFVVEAMDVIHGMEENFTKAAALAGETVTMTLAVSKAALPMNTTNLVEIANQIAQTAEDSLVSKATVLRVRLIGCRRWKILQGLML